MNASEKELVSVLIDYLQANNLTLKKTDDIIKRDKSVITGFVVTDAYGNIGIIDKSVVRWISKEQWSQL